MREELLTAERQARWKEWSVLLPALAGHPDIDVVSAAKKLRR